MLFYLLGKLGRSARPARRRQKSKSPGCGTTPAFSVSVRRHWSRPTAVRNRRIARALSQDFRCEPLRFGDSLHLDGDGVDRRIESTQAVGDVVQPDTRVGAKRRFGAPLEKGHDDPRQASHSGDDADEQKDAVQNLALHVSSGRNYANPNGFPYATHPLAVSLPSDRLTEPDSGCNAPRGPCRRAPRAP